MNGRLCFSPGFFRQIKKLGLKSPAIRREPFLRSPEHLGRSVKPLHRTGRPSLEESFRKQALATAQFDDGKRLIEGRNEVNDDLQLALAFRDKITPIVEKHSRDLFVPAARGILRLHGSFLAPRNRGARDYEQRADWLQSARPPLSPALLKIFRFDRRLTWFIRLLS